MLRALLAIGSVQLIAMLVLLGRTKALALLLGPEQLGLLAVVDHLLAVFVQTASLSLPFAALRFLPSLGGTDAEGFRRRLRDMGNLLLWASALATVLGLGLAAFRPSSLGAELARHRAVLLAGFASLPALAFVPFAQNAIAARLEHRGAMSFSLAHAVVLALTSVAGVWLAGLAGLYALYAIAASALALVGLSRAGLAPRAWTLGEGPRGLLSLRLPGAVWRFALALLALSFLAPWAALYINYRVLGEFGVEAVGWMQAAVGISIAVRAVFGAAHPVLLTPNVNRDASLEERMRWANEYQGTLSVLVGALVPPVMLFPHLFVSLLYSPRFSGGAVAVAWFVLAEVLTLLGGTYGSLVVACDEMAFHVAQNVAAQLTLVGAGALLIPVLGIRGAGLAGILAWTLLLLASATFLRRRYGLRIPARVVAVGAYVLAALAVAGEVGVSLPAFTARIVGVKLGLYAAVLAGLLLLVGAAGRARLRDLLGGRVAPRPEPGA